MITKDKKISSMLNQIKLGIAMVGMLCLFYPICGQAEALNLDQRIVELQEKFPDGKYWNRVGLSEDNSDGYTDNPCTLHKTSGVDHVYGTGGCTCNHFTDGFHLSATQCMGFANKLGYDVFGKTKWTKFENPSSNQIASIAKGDIVRIDGYHSVFVMNREGNNITVGEANYPNGCEINWGREIDLTTVTVSYYEHADNYDSVVTGTGDSSIEEDGSNSETPGESTTEQEDNTETSTESEDSNYTGWKKASDGVHYQYYKSGKLQKNKWLTINKKKYYLDKKGYRATGFYDVKNQTYYFNSKGVMQKDKWFKLDGQIYYVNNSGLLLKSQWLYYNNVLVYVTQDGSIAKNEIVKIGSKQYYFGSNGKRSKGFKKCNGKYYYCDSNGVIQKKKWITMNGNKYYLQKSGVRAQSKLLKIGKYKFYFNNKGHMVKNKRITYKEKIYKADKKGRCRFVKNVVATE